MISKKKEDFNLMEHVMKQTFYARVLVSHRNTGKAVLLYFALSHTILSVSWSGKKKNNQTKPKQNQNI